jgi:hypothetical protein
VQYIINAEGVLSPSLEGPLAPYLGLFSEEVSELGYGLDSLKKQVRIAAFFSRWLEQHSVLLPEVSSEHARRFLRYRNRQGLLHRGDAAALQRFIEFLCREGAIPAQKMLPVRLTAVEQCALDFGRYLRDECRISSDWTPLISSEWDHPISG